ncbi:MAG: SLC13 family permease, partial [Oscillospiraceae bacterium]
METAKKFNVVKLLKIVIPALIAVAIAMIQPVGELTVESMRFAGIFICLIIWMVCDVWPDFVITLVGLCAFVVVGVCSFKEAFAPFASSSVWLVIGAFGLSAGVAKSGLLKRLSYMILKLFPENFRGQIMALFATGLVISPLIPSLNAKAAILGPFSAQISESLGYEKSSKGARGLFGAMVISTTVLGMAFYSGAVPVFTLIGFMDEVQQAQFHWMSWFAGTWLWLIIMVALCFVAIIVLYKPTGNNAVIEKGLAK